MIFSISSGVNDSIYGKSQAPIRKFVFDDEKKYLQNSKIKEIFNMVDSDQYAEKFTSMTSKGDFAPVGEGGQYPLTSMREGFSKTIEPYTWKSSFEVTQEMVEDAKMFKVKARAKEFMTSYTRTREKYGASLLLNGNKQLLSFGGFNFDISCNDGQSLFSDGHMSITGETTNQSNYYNMPFSYDNLCLVEEAMQKYVNDNGELVGIEPDTIIIPNNAKIKKKVADAIYTSSGTPGLQTHSVNFNESRWNVIVWDKLNNLQAGTNDDVWFMMDSTRNAIDGLMWIDRVELSVKSYIDERTDNNIFGGRARFAAAPVNWRSVAGCFPGVASTTLTL